MQNALDFAQSVMAIGFVVAAILGGRFIADRTEARSISRYGLLALFWLGFVPLGAAMASQGPAAFRGLSPGVVVGLRIISTILVSCPLMIGGTFLAHWSFWVYRNGFFMGANQPGQPKELVMGIVGLGLIVVGIVSVWLIWVAVPI